MRAAITTLLWVCSPLLTATLWAQRSAADDDTATPAGANEGADPAPTDEGETPTPATGDETDGANDRAATAEAAPVDARPAEAAEAPAESAAPAASEPKPRGLSLFSQALTGHLSLSYRARGSKSETDHDLNGFGVLDWGDGEQDAYSLHAAALLDWDLDGVNKRHASGQRPAPTRLPDLSDASSERVRTLLLEAWAQARDVVPDSVLRAGRLPLDEGIAPLFDGGEATWRRDDLRVQGLAGVPVHYYEGRRAGDFTAGGGAGYRFGSWLRLDGLYVYLRDDNANYEEATGARTGDATDGFLKITGRSAPIEALSLRGEAEFLDWRGQRFAAWAQRRCEDCDLDVQAGVTWLRLARRDFSTAYGPLWNALGSEQPYWQGELRLVKGLGDYAWAEVGGSVRRLADSDDEGDFNHELARGYGSAGLIDWPIEGLELSATADATGGNDASARTSVSGDAAYECFEGFRVRAYSAYDRFRYDLLLADELDNVRTWGLEADYRLTDWGVRARLSYELEHTEGTTYHQGRLRVSYDF